MLKNNQILKIYGTAYKEMTKKLLEASDLAACIGSRQKQIGIKPNLVTPSPADYGATTHSEVVAGIVEYLQERNFRNILILEGSWVGDRTAEAYEYCGYRELCGKYGVPFCDTQKEHAHTVDCAGMKLHICDVVDRIDFLINVPVLKGHCQTKVTCALKNLKGLIPNSEKSRFHRMGLHGPIAHLQTAVHQDFIVVDHICGDLDFEEGGRPVVRNCIMAGRDPVLVDSYGCRLLNYDAGDVAYIPMAEELGIGSTRLEDAEIWQILVPAGSAGTEDFCLPGDHEGGPEGLPAGIRFVPDSERPFTNRRLDVSYAVCEADSCSACYAALTGALYRLEEDDLLDRLDIRIGIGQGMRGKKGVFGVGRCTKEFEESVPGCPPSEEAVYQALRRRIDRSGSGLKKST